VIVDEAEIDRVLRRFDRLKKAIIDASSIIYAKKAGFLDILSRSLYLITVPAVVVEVGKGGGTPEPRMSLIQPPNPEENADRQLVALAKTAKKPLISEDRTILQICRRKDIEYYNAYMMLIMLRYRGVVDIRRYQEIRDCLIEISHYGKLVLSYAAAFSDHLDKIM
jgi:hypothetical protein